MTTLANAMAQMIASAQKANPQQPEDYKGEDGLLYCGVCHQRKQCQVELFEDGKLFTVPCMCQCKKEQLEREERESKLQEARGDIDHLRSVFKIPKKLKDAYFKNYEQKEYNAKAFKIARKYFQNFDEMYAKSSGLLFYGSVGTGKSWMAVCVMHALWERYIPAALTSLNDILRMLQERTITEEEIYRLFWKAKLLILDDLGAERETSFALEKVYNVIDKRIQSCKPLILKTTLTFEELTAPQDIRYKRIYDRILEVCYPVCMSEPSFRLEEARKRKAEMKALFAEDAEQ